MTDPTARIIKLTPKLAQDLIARNPRNRVISQANLLKITRAIENGEWALNGEAVKIDLDGYILDGQHRCHAVVKTGVAIRTFLIEGLAPSTQETMDQGKSRSLSDFLAMRKVKNATRVAACTSRVYLYERRGLAAAFSRESAVRISTVKEQLAWFEANRWIEDVAVESREVQSLAKYPGSAGVAVLMVAFAGIDLEDSDHFWRGVKTGIGLAANSPILLLRKTLDAHANESRGARGERYAAAITIKAWNAYRDGQSISLLRFRPGGANPENFPTPR